MKLHTITCTTLTLISLSPVVSGSTAQYDHVTQVIVNNINVAQPITALQVEKAVGMSIKKVSKISNECTGNYEYSAETGAKKLNFEIFSEDNPNIKNESFYKNKNDYKQLGTTKGRLWLSWDKIQELPQTIQLNKSRIGPLYTEAQFKQDFPKSAKLLGKDKIAYVIMIDPNTEQQYIKNKKEYDLPYIGNLEFKFKNGKLSQLAIQQGIAC